MSEAAADGDRGGLDPEGLRSTGTPSSSGDEIEIVQDQRVATLKSAGLSG